MSYMPALGSLSLGFGVLGLELMGCVVLTQGRTGQSYTQNKGEAQIQWGLH